MTAAWAAGLVSVSREHPRGRGQCVFKCARLCEIECVAMRSSSGGVCKALGEEPRGWTGCLSNTLFPFSLDRQTTRGTEMATRTERRPLCDNPGPEVACSQDEFALFSLTSKPAYVQKPRVAFVRIIVTNSLNNCNIPK